MLFVFQPTPPMNDPDDMVPAISDDGVSVMNIKLYYLNTDTIYPG